MQSESIAFSHEFGMKRTASELPLIALMLLVMAMTLVGVGLRLCAAFFGDPFLWGQCSQHHQFIGSDFVR